MLLVAMGLVACNGETASSSAQSEPGCSTAPACASCSTCFERCTCEGGDNVACADQCAGSAGAAGAGGGSGSGGATGVGGGGSGGSTFTTVTLATSPRTVAPGEEAYFCQNFSNPFGQDVEIVESESFMTPGSHHMFVFRKVGATDGPVQDCSGLEFENPVHTAQTPQHLTKYPPGVGRFVSAGTGLRVSAHYLNTSQKPVEAVITVQFKVASAGTMQHHAGALFFLNPSIYVAPFQTGGAKDTCTLPQDIQLIDVVSHMHSFGTKFDAKTSDGKNVYATTNWDDPEPTVFSPPLALGQGTQISYECSYKNTLSQPLTFGESAQTNEMCILSGTYFPAPNGAVLDCQ